MRLLRLFLCIQFELRFFDGDKATYRALLIVEGRDSLRSYKAIFTFLNKAHMDAFGLEFITVPANNEILMMMMEAVRTTLVHFLSSNPLT